MSAAHEVAPTVLETCVVVVDHGTGLYGRILVVGTLVI